MAIAELLEVGENVERLDPELVVTLSGASVVLFVCLQVEL